MKKKTTAPRTAARRKQIVDLLASGLTPKDVAMRLGMTVDAVEMEASAAATEAAEEQREKDKNSRDMNRVMFDHKDWVMHSAMIYLSEWQCQFEQTRNADEATKEAMLCFMWAIKDIVNDSVIWECYCTLARRMRELRADPNAKFHAAIRNKLNVLEGDGMVVAAEHHLIREGKLPPSATDGTVAGTETKTVTDNGQ